MACTFLDMRIRSIRKKWKHLHLPSAKELHSCTEFSKASTVFTTLRTFERISFLQLVQLRTALMTYDLASSLALLVYDCHYRGRACGFWARVNIG